MGTRFLLEIRSGNISLRMRASFRTFNDRKLCRVDDGASCVKDEGEQKDSTCGIPCQDHRSCRGNATDLLVDFSLEDDAYVSRKDVCCDLRFES